MHPYLFRIELPWGGTFEAASYGFMILIGFLLSLWLFQRRGRRVGMNPQKLFDAAVAGLAAGIVGARVFYVIDFWDSFAEKGLLEVFSIWQGGLSFFGGLVGGTLGLLVALRVKKLPLRKSLGVAASVMPLGHAFGRLGCFLNGCCYGKITSSWVGLEFPRVVNEEGTIVGSAPFLDHLNSSPEVTVSHTHSLPIHPTQLYAVGYLLLIFGIVSYLFPRQRRQGDVAWLYPVLYGVARFSNEFFRADTSGIAYLGGLTLFQVLAIGAVIFGAAMLGISLSKPAEPQPEPWQPEGEGGR